MNIDVERDDLRRFLSVVRAVAQTSTDNAVYDVYEKLLNAVNKPTTYRLMFRAGTRFDRKIDSIKLIRMGLKEAKELCERGYETPVVIYTELSSQDTARQHINDYTTVCGDHYCGTFTRLGLENEDVINAFKAQFWFERE